MQFLSGVEKMAKTLVEMTQEIIQSQISSKQMTLDEIKSACTDIFQTLKSLQEATQIGRASCRERV